jgi:hypothetical protein
MIRLNFEEECAWASRKSRPYPRWKRCDTGFLLYVNRGAWREDVFHRRDGKWKVRNQVFERLDDALCYGEVVYYRQRADEIEARSPAERCY